MVTEIPQTEERTFKTFAIQDLNLAELPEAQRQHIAEVMVAVSQGAEWWMTEDNLRYSIVRCFVLPVEHVCGWLTQQHRLFRHAYDDDKHETTEALHSYEDRFFAVHLAANLLTVEWRQFRRMPPLTLDLMMSNLTVLFNDVLKRCGIGAEVRLEPIDKETTREEFLGLFYGHRVVEVAVSGFGTMPIPEDVVLVNPMPQLEGVARQIVQHDALPPSIGRLVAEVAKGLPEADLRRSTIARQALHSGIPESLRYETQHGTTRLRRRREKGEVTLPVPVLDGDAPEERNLYAARVTLAMQGLDVSVEVTQSARVTRSARRTGPQAQQLGLWDERED